MKLIETLFMFQVTMIIWPTKIGVYWCLGAAGIVGDALALG